MDLFQSANFTGHVHSLMNQYRTPGLAIALVQNRSTASAGYGWASIEESRPCTADTIFEIASSSKSLTAASVALLVQDNEHFPDVQYDAVMSDLLPGDFQVTGLGYTEGITVEDILSHRTGMAPHDYSYLGIRAAHPDNAQSVTRNLRNLQVAAPLRSKYIYCNMMYTVATYLLEKVTGTAFADFLDTRIFQPLGMNSSNLQPDRTREKGLGDRIATGYVWDSESNRFVGFQEFQAPEAQGAGQIYTSVNDYIRYVKAIMNHESIFTETMVKDIIKGRIIEDPDQEDGLPPLSSPSLYGTGWDTFYYRGHKVVSHDGNDPGYNSIHFFLPEVSFGGVIFGNSDGSGDTIQVLYRELIDAALKVPYAERPNWNGIQSAQANAPKEQGDDTQEILDELCPGLKHPQPQENALRAYTGTYDNAGYHSVTVQIKNDQLFINATDRSMQSVLIFEHLCNQTKYLAHLYDVLDGSDSPVPAEFKLTNGKADKLGIKFEDELEEYIWFGKK